MSTSEVRAVENFVGNGSKSEGNLSKEARKQEKRSQKLAREHENVTSVAAPLLAVGQVNGLDGASEKADRKAEKARLRRERKTVRTENGDAGTATNGTSELDSGYMKEPSLAALPQSEIDDFLSTNFIITSDLTSSTNLRPII